MWAKRGSPGPKLIDGIPASLNLATSVHACFGKTSASVEEINLLTIGLSLLGIAPKETLSISTSPKLENLSIMN